MTGYGWDEYDIRNGGRQTIHDNGNNLDLTIDFIKVPGGDKGGNWGARVKGVPMKGADPDQPTTVVFHAGLEGEGNIEVASERELLGFTGDVKLEGTAPGLGDFKIDVTTGSEDNKHPKHDHPTYQDKPLDRTLVASLTMPKDNVWQTKG